MDFSRNKVDGSKYRFLAGDEAYFEQHVRNASGHGLPRQRNYPRASISGQAQSRRAGAGQAVLREICLGRTR